MEIRDFAPVPRWTLLYHGTNASTASHTAASTGRAGRVVEVDVAARRAPSAHGTSTSEPMSCGGSALRTLIAGGSACRTAGGFPASTDGLRRRDLASDSAPDSTRRRGGAARLQLALLGARAPQGAGAAASALARRELAGAAAQQLDGVGRAGERVGDRRRRRGPRRRRSAAPSARRRAAERRGRRCCRAAARRSRAAASAAVAERMVRLFMDSMVRRRTSIMSNDELLAMA